MGRFLTILGAFVLFGMVAVYMGWFGFSSTTTSDGGHQKIEITMDNAKIKSDADKVRNEVKDLSRKTSDGLRNITDKTENGASTPNRNTTLETDKKSIDLEPGAHATVRFTRRGPELPALQLILTPSASSNLTATGGEFKANDREASIVIEAPAGATDGSVNVEGNGDSQRIYVTMKSKI